MNLSFVLLLMLTGSLLQCMKTDSHKICSYCVCLCVCLYTSTVEASSVFNDVSGILRCGHYTRYFCQVHSSPFLNLSFSPPKMKLQQDKKLKRKLNDMWYNVTYLCMKECVFDINFNFFTSNATYRGYCNLNFSSLTFGISIKKIRLFFFECNCVVLESSS